MTDPVDYKKTLDALSKKELTMRAYLDGAVMVSQHHRGDHD